jgi:hypothetical protein
MRVFLTLAAVEISMIGFAGANPIAIDSTRRSISLIAETVEIAVQPTHSIVSGTYSFRQGKDEYAFPGEKADHITIEIPVMIRGKPSFDSLKSATAATVSIGKRVFRPTGSSSASALRGLPRGYTMCLVEFEVPLRAVAREFTAVIRYTQPHLPGGIAPYYPVRPPESIAAKSLVRYTAAAPASLALLSKRVKVVETSPTRIAVQPEDGKLILVRVNKT